MSRGTRLLAVAAVVVVGLTAGGQALAQPSAKRPGRVAAGFLATAASYIGIERKQLVVELRGHSLAQVAIAHGKTESGLEQALLGALKTRLDRAVSAKKLSPAGEQLILGRAPAALSKLVNHVWTGRALKAKRVVARNVLVQAAAGYFGLTPKALRDQLHGTSLAALAAAKGRSVDELAQALVGALEARLDKAQQAGRISAQRERAILARAGARVNKLLQHVWK